MINDRKSNLTERSVLEILKKVIDPELYVNIIDLGLVYAISVREKPMSINIELTLTSKGCPMGDAIIQDIEQTLYRHYPGINVNIELVWEPEWNIEMVTEDGRNALRIE